MSTYAFVILLISHLHPDALKTGSSSTWAKAISWAVDHDPLPPGMTKEKAAAVLAVTAWEEGRFCIGCKRGDISVHAYGSVCTFQVRALSESAARLFESDPISCARAGYYVVREGARMCPQNPLAPYAGGCTNQAAQAVSKRRMDEAARLVRESSAM